jgi:hypothetical protein
VGATLEIPDSAIGREFGSWLEAIDPHDPDTLLAHHKTFESRPDEAEARAAMDLMVSKPCDRLILHEIEEAPITRPKALIKVTLSEE